MLSKLRYEVEIKIKPYAPYAELYNFISKICNNELYSITEKDLYLIHPCKDFTKTDEALRIREVNYNKNKTTKCIITYKGPRQIINGLKKRIEIEFTTNSCNEAIELFKALGFTEFITISKKRHYCRTNECIITLDNVENLGIFIEIEGPFNEVKKLLNQIPFNYDIVEKTYLELLLEKLK